MKKKKIMYRGIFIIAVLAVYLFIFTPGPIIRSISEITPGVSEVIIHKNYDKYRSRPEHEGAYILDDDQIAMLQTLMKGTFYSRITYNDEIPYGSFERFDYSIYIRNNPDIDEWTLIVCSNVNNIMSNWINRNGQILLSRFRIIHLTKTG